MPVVVCFKHQTTIRTCPNHLDTAPSLQTPSTMSADKKVTLKQIFDSVDANGDNSISMCELKTAMSGSKDFTEDDLKEFCQVCDNDGDKKISYAEFEAFFTALLSQ